ncbi:MULTISPECIES: Spy/CpxP family protein refolding chaperone [Rhodomicrobium]|uniref:Spy/CpxP family protein refolding chaperone n=1 Tax=Rhodomicrobium TaxID=1068 RepID=UPI0014830E53|nr:MULTISPECIES: Spy/CpxP family protein refolding chaperone [Rhodomicrobium]
MTRKAMLAAAILAMGLAAGAGSALTQQRGPGFMMGEGWGRGMMGREGHMGPRGMMGMGGCPMMAFDDDGETATFAAGRIAFLKAELGITDAQKDVWDAYALALQANLDSMRGMHLTMQSVFEAKTPVERLDAQLAAMDGRVNALKQIRSPLAKLYEALGGEQRKKADDVLTGMGCMM